LLLAISIGSVFYHFLFFLFYFIFLLPPRLNAQDTAPAMHVSGRSSLFSAGAAVAACQPHWVAQAFMQLFVIVRLAFASM
jgi:hypothetical protein